MKLRCRHIPLRNIVEFEWKHVRISACICLFMGFFTVHAQVSSDSSDDSLAAAFTAFQAADFEAAYKLLPSLRTRFAKELETPSSFNNPYDSLSKLIGIRWSSDSVLKTYCWSERNGSCCHTSATFVQFQTEKGTVAWADLEALEDSDEETFITGLYRIEINHRPYYLITGWGTCCGGKHYEVARVYEIKDGKLKKYDAFLGDRAEIYAGGNRTQEMELSYDPSSKTLSYIHFGFDENIGFHTDEQTQMVWKLMPTGFELSH